jgi:hypothetical protein
VVEFVFEDECQGKERPRENTAREFGGLRFVPFRGNIEKLQFATYYHRIQQPFEMGINLDRNCASVVKK